ncbi:MAG: hypothetical protein HKO03_11705 [Acidimicrobiia bacterium]|nr:hypothetical protein [Acidimicrobiia bacterium]
MTELAGATRLVDTPLDSVVVSITVVSGVVVSVVVAVVVVIDAAARVVDAPSEDSIVEVGAVVVLLGRAAARSAAVTSGSEPGVPPQDATTSA